MGRGKVQLRRIENPVHQQVTFCKRRNGLLKKAKELSILCDANVGLIVFSSHGKLFELATRGNMQGLIERYLETYGVSQSSKPQDGEQEMGMLKQEIELLQKGLRCIYGKGTEHIALEELLFLERQLEIWINHIRTAKMQNMIQEIQLLKKKEGILKAANEMLQEKIVEQNIVQILQQNGIFSAPQLIEDI